MLDKVESMPEAEFIRIWNSSNSLDEATEKVKAAVGTRCPRCAVLARAVGQRRGGVEMKGLRPVVKYAGCAGDGSVGRGR
jgi:hypothetical protein